MRARTNLRYRLLHHHNYKTKLHLQKASLQIGLFFLRFQLDERKDTGDAASEGEGFDNICKCNYSTEKDKGAAFELLQNEGSVCNR